jgi:uncharacterized protein (DUF885 family)
VTADPSALAQSDVRMLADELHGRLLEHDPLAASMYGIEDYDGLLPDVSEPAGRQLVAEVTGILGRADGLSVGTADDAVTLAALRYAATGAISYEQVAALEFTTSSFEHGPGLLMLVASDTAPQTSAAAAAHLERARGYASYLDTCVERLREGAAKGRTPVAALVERVATQLAGWLSGESPDALAAVPGPADEPGFAAELADIVTSSTRPAIERYHALLTDTLLPVARDDDHVGLIHLPGGAEDYDRMVAVHTTLPTTAREVHATGEQILAEIGARMTELGAGLGQPDLTSLLAHMVRVSAAADPVAAIATAREVVRRAEAVAPDWFSAPLPGPCRVEAMDAGLARAGMAPHYIPPLPDGSRAGKYAFNAEIAGAGGGWDLESVAFHEAVPGHHLQIARDLLRTDLPALQRQWGVTAFAEGWGLYAEVLAEEMGLYSSAEMRLGSLAMQAFRAARLVVDTGMHGLGWSRERALQRMVDTVPLPAGMLAAEIDRYVAMPGQALAYMTGQRELLRLRAAAAVTLGDRFDVRGFHDAVLGHGQVPLPAVAAAVDAWVAGAA